MEKQLLNDYAQYELDFDKSGLVSQDDESYFLLKEDHEIIKNYFHLKVADLLSIAGDNKRFQKIILVVFSLLGIIAAFVIYELPFIYFSPNFSCKTEDGEYFKCTEKEACNSKYGFKTENVKISLETEFDIFCENKSLETHAKSFIFFFAGVLVMILSIISDYIGRLPIFYISWFLCILGTSLSYFAKNYYIIVLGVAISFTGVDLFYSTLFIYTNETIGRLIRIKNAKCVERTCFYLLRGRGDVFRSDEHLDHEL